MKQHERMKVLEDHLKIDHKQSRLSMHLKEVIYGAVDGIITTFAIVAGFSGAALSNETTTQLSFVMVLLFGLANLFADGVSMGLGNFLAVRSEQSLYRHIRDKEKTEVKHNPEFEAEETKTILVSQGFSETDADTLTEIYKKNNKYWIDFMMNHELKIPDPRGENPMITGFATFAAFVLFGAIPLLPFIFMGDANPQVVFWYSTGGALFALVLLGFLKWRIVEQSLFKCVGEIVLVGSVAAAVAFFVGTFFAI